MSELKDLMRQRQAQAGRRLELREMQRQAADAQTGAVDAVRWVSLDHIIIDNAIQVRQAGLDPDRVRQYALAMVEYGGWGEFPPLDIFRDPETGELFLAGGFHRRAAVDEAQVALIEDGKSPILEVPCVVHPGGRAAAIEFAEDDNLTHGLNLTSRDKRAMYERRLTVNHPWSQYSNRRVAAELGVSEITIRRWRKEMTATNVAVEDTTTRIGRDGREMDVRGIQAASAARAHESSLPEWEDAEADARAEWDEEVVQRRGKRASGQRVTTSDHLTIPEFHLLHAALKQMRGATKTIIELDSKKLFEVDDARLRELRGIVEETLDMLGGYEDQEGELVLGAWDVLDKLHTMLRGFGL